MNAYYDFKFQYQTVRYKDALEQAVCHRARSRDRETHPVIEPHGCLGAPRMVRTADGSAGMSVPMRGS
jgi:hypothetical protein